MSPGRKLSIRLCELQPFGLMMSRYQPLPLSTIGESGQGVWLEEAELRLGLWEGTYQGLNRLWLRWYDREHNWIPTPTEREARRAERLAARLRALGIDPDEVETDSDTNTTS